jgi:predicted nucleic acid-binding Zn ribbon protein
MSKEPFRPAKLADALQQWMTAAPHFAQRLAAASVVDEWAALVGPQIASVAQAHAVAADGTLWVAVTTNAWMSELAMMERELLDLLNGSAGPVRVKKIRWQLARK